MKRLIWIGLVLLTCALPCQAQSTAESASWGNRFLGGPVVGFNTTQVDGDALGGFHKVGLNLGASIYWFFTKDFALELEMLYSQKGSKGVKEGNDPSTGAFFTKYKLQLNYMEVPLLVHYLVKDRYLVGIGGSFNFLLNHKEDFEGLMLPPHSDDQGEFEKKSVDLIGSVGYKLSPHFLVQARYQYGLTKLRDRDQVIPFLPGMGERNQFNNMLTFRLFYLF